MKQTKISIIIPCLNEENYIGDCLESVLHSDYENDLLEIFVVDGESNDATIKIVEQYMKKYSNIHLLTNTKKIVPISMNMGIKAASGEYIIRLDAHALYPKEYFSKLIEWYIKLDADNVGGVWITDVKNKNTKSNSIKSVLSNQFGVGNSIFRIGTKNVQEVDTVPFGCYKKDIFDKYGYYNEKLIRNQDIEFNKRIRRGGGKIYLIPEITCTYFARENFTSLIKNNYANGLWNILTSYYTKTFNSLSVRHFVPLLFLISLLVPLLLGYFYIFLVIFTAYILAITIISLKIKDKSNSILYLIVSFMTLHFSYGVGSLMGILKTVVKYIKGNR